MAAEGMVRVEGVEGVEVPATLDGSKRSSDRIKWHLVEGSTDTVEAWYYRYVMRNGKRYYRRHRMGIVEALQAPTASETDIAETLEAETRYTFWSRMMKVDSGMFHHHKVPLTLTEELRMMKAGHKRGQVSTRYLPLGTTPLDVRGVEAVKVPLILTATPTRTVGTIKGVRFIATYYPIGATSADRVSQGVIAVPLILT